MHPYVDPENKKKEKGMSLLKKMAYAYIGAVVFLMVVLIGHCIYMSCKKDLAGTLAVVGVPAGIVLFFISIGYITQKGESNVENKNKDKDNNFWRQSY